MTRGEIDLAPSKLDARRKLSLNLGTHKETTQEYLYKQIETDRSVQVVWCEYAWKLSANSKGGTLSLVTRYYPTLTAFDLNAVRACSRIMTGWTSDY